MVSTIALPFLSDFDKIFKIAFVFVKDGSLYFCHGWVIFGVLGGTKKHIFIGLQLVSTMPLPFSSDFDTIVKIAVLYKI